MTLRDRLVDLLLAAILGGPGRAVLTGIAILVVLVLAAGWWTTAAILLGGCAAAVWDAWRAPGRWRLW